MLNTPSIVAILFASSAVFAAAAVSPTFSREERSGGVNGTYISQRQEITGGVATFYSQEGFAGKCGVVHADSDLVVSIASARYGTADESPLCFEQVQVTNLANSKSVVATIVDECVFCQNSNSMDMSDGAFEAIASLSDGEINIEWEFV